MSSSWTTSAATKGKAVRRAIRAARTHLLFLPPYSPHLNPIEQVFAKLKTLLRKPANALLTPSGRALATCSTASVPPNVPTTRETQDMPPPSRKML